MKPLVALDTNAFLMPIRNDIRVFDELDRLVPGNEPVTIDAVIEELDALRETESGKEAMAASVGADLARRCRVIEPDDGFEGADVDADYADDAFVELARRGRFEYVATNDGPLRQRLLDARVPVIHLRGKHKLTITQP